MTLIQVISAVNTHCVSLFVHKHVFSCVSFDTTEFLKKAQPQQIVDASPKTLTDDDARKNVGLAFVPSVEKRLEATNDLFREHDQPFLTEHPIELMKQGKFHKVPLMLGFDSHEAMLFVRRE